MKKFLKVFSCITGGLLSILLIWILISTKEPIKSPVELSKIENYNLNTIPPDAIFIYDFGHSVNTSTVDGNYFLIQEPCSIPSCKTSRKPNGTVKCLNNSCLLVPAEKLECGRDYCACLTMGIKDAAGNAIFREESGVGFKTAQCPLLTRVNQGVKHIWNVTLFYLLLKSVPH